MIDYNYILNHETKDNSVCDDTHNVCIAIQSKVLWTEQRKRRRRKKEIRTNFGGGREWLNEQYS